MTPVHPTLPPPILRLGDARLRGVCPPVADPRDPAVRSDAAALLAALDDFRARAGFGRAIAAPQIGVQRRLIACRIPEWPTALVNPVVDWRSPETVTLWDDCLCFPDLLVRVRRATSISVSFADLDGTGHHRERLDTATSELLQHEIDHLDGILATDLALDTESTVTRSVFEAGPDRFLERVDYKGFRSSTGPARSSRG